LAGPEQALLKKERESLLRNAFRKVIELFPQHKDIAYLWWDGKSPNEIAEQTGKPIQTVYRILKKIQQALTTEIRH
jgi:DNA-directed RNA polymerase specialized sigma24 family protein